MVEIKNATKIIRGKTVLKDIDFAPQAGKIYGLEGHNGSGKTMLLRLCCNLIKPTSGEVVIDKGTTFGALIETPGFMFNETAYDNLKYLAEINKKIGKDKINEILNRVGLADRKNIKTKKYSLGMLQKLGIAQAVMEDPDVLLLDEPFNTLDGESCKTVKDLIIEQKARGAAVVIVSHKLDCIRDECDFIHQMTDGILQ
ncbi:MAG: ABC transporter ATP-binding protein [Acutalibacteraceae bacterium]